MKKVIDYGDRNTPTTTKRQMRIDALKESVDGLETSFYLRASRNRIARKVCLGLILGATASSLSACSTSSSMFGGSDIQISATEEGMKAYGDHISAIITNGKASADSDDTPAYELRRAQETGRTMRAKYKGGFAAKSKGGQ